MAAALLAVAGLAVGRRVWGPLSAGERAVVGTWRVRPEVAGYTPLEYEFRADRSCLIRSPGGGSGVVTWRRTGDRLRVRHPDGAAGPWWDVVGLPWPVDEVLVLAADGPDRYRYVGTIEVGGRPDGPPVAGTLTRIAPGGVP